MSYAGADDAAADGGPAPVYGSGGYFNAAYDLTGPGSHASVQYGAYSSYAYESYYGGVYEENTTRFSDGYTINARYSYSDGYSTYTRTTSFTDYSTPSYYGAYGYGGAYAGYGVTGFYTADVVETCYDGAAESVGTEAFSRTTYGDGVYHDTSSSMSADYENGMQVPGTATSYAGSSYGYVGSTP